jgi:murein DD-endopeptidase MepM/ murein hydrolase activator NlpD
LALGKWKNHGVRRLAALTVACILFILCGISVSASRFKGKHKDISRLSAGLKSVKESAKKARARLAALTKREAVLVAKIEDETNEEVAGDEEGEIPNTSFAKSELTKVRFEKKALIKKIKTCELNKKCILAEIQVVSQVAPELPEANDIQFEKPMSGRITSGFGMRIHPISHVEKEHQGIDFAGAIGDTVKAAANGQVVFAATQRGYGKIVIIKHSETMSTAYGHLSEITVIVGEAVAVGEKIGEVGQSGNSTGPHLHFEIRENGVQVNPTKYL